MLKKFSKLEKVAESGYLLPRHLKEVFGVPSFLATLILECGVRFGHFDPCYNLQCSKCHRFLGTYNYKFEIPRPLVEEKCLSSEDFFCDPKVEKVYLILDRNIS